MTWPCQALLAATFSTSLLGEPNDDDDVILILFCVLCYIPSYNSQLGHVRKLRCVLRLLHY